MIARLTIGLLAALIAVPAIAQTCPTPALPLPAELAGWARPVAARSGDAVPIGQAMTVTLVSAPAFAAPPEKAPSVGSFGGTLAVTVTTAGRYRVALGAPVWIDVVREGKVLASTAHGHGPACSGVRKTVDFALTTGRYTVQLSGSATSSATVLVAHLP